MKNKLIINDEALTIINHLVIKLLFEIWF